MEYNSLDPAKLFVLLEVVIGMLQLYLWQIIHINEIDRVYETIKLFHHEAELEISDKIMMKKRIIIYLCNFSNINMQISNFDVKFLYNNLGRSKILDPELLHLKN